MIIRKLYKFENAHIVRNCSTLRCKTSLHGHSYKVEVLLESDMLDYGQMVYDFGLMKLYIKDIVDSFDHATSFWANDDEQYIEFIKKFSARWVCLPVSPSAEQLSRIIFILIDKLLFQTTMVNQEGEVRVNSVIVHETDTGYAQCFLSDAYSKKMGKILCEDIIFSEQIKKSWRDSQMFEKLIFGESFVNPTVVEE